MSASVRWDGLEELIRELDALPEELHREAVAIVSRAAERTYNELVPIYQSHRKTGNLARGLSVVVPNSRLAIAVVREASPHGHLFEFGTRPRPGHGTMPAADQLVPIATRNRAIMYAELRALIERKGGTVEGLI